MDDVIQKYSDVYIYIRRNYVQKEYTKKLKTIYVLEDKDLQAIVKMIETNKNISEEIKSIFVLSFYDCIKGIENSDTEMYHSSYEFNYNKFKKITIKNISKYKI